MNAKTLKALKDSIEHWERLATGKQHAFEWIYADDCALCSLFIKNMRARTCRGCPVMKKSGRILCYNTPWENVMNTLDRFAYGTPQFKAAAQKQLDFLKSLLPKSSKS